MEERKSKTIYILIAVAIISLLAYFALTFFTIFKVNGIEYTIYSASFGGNSLKASPLLIISAITASIALVLLITMLILLPFKKRRHIYILLDVLSLPLLTFTLVVNIFILPIFKTSNDVGVDNITVMHQIIIPQCICLFIAIALNISIIFYLSIKGYKRYNYERRRGVR